VPDIRSDLWAKLLANLAGGPFSILTRLGVRDTFADPVLREAVFHCAEEARAIAAALGRPLPPAASERVRASNMVHKPSILQDLELGRPMEIDTIFTLPLKLARLAGLETPRLDLMVALAKQAARSAGLYPPIG
jgi:2-dehydropantoate 2-reductase